MAYGRWPVYVPVAVRRAKAAKAMDKLRKQGKQIYPIEKFGGRKIAKTFWGESWCEHLEKFSDYENRLPRGKTYVRNGSVLHLGISKGEIEAIVSGSSLYHIKVTIKPLSKTKWNQVKKACAGQIGSMLELLQGHLSNHVMEIVTDSVNGLFPNPGEIKLACDCPDWAALCKHLAAVLYGVGARLDTQPELLFLLRGVNQEELVDAELDVQAATATKGGRRRIASQDLESIFDIEIEAAPKPRNKKKLTAKAKTSTGRIVKNKTAVKAKASPRDVRPFNPTAASVKRLRKSFDMTTPEFSILVGVSPASIMNWERQKGRLSLQQRSKDALEKVFGLTHVQAKRRLKKNLAK